MRTSALLLLTCLISLQGFAQHSLGVFDNHEDIGNPKHTGDAQYDSLTQTYTIEGSGYNIWFNRDEFQYVYKKIGGDFMLTADFAFTGDTTGVVGHRKTGWMIRASTDADALGINACKHIDGLTALQWREMHGAYMMDPAGEIFWSKKGGTTIQLRRSGKTISMYVAHPGEPLQLVGKHRMEYLPDSVLVGLYVCSHDSNSVAGARVWNVRIDKPIRNAYYPNPQVARLHPPFTGTLRARLETMDVFDGVRKVVDENYKQGPEADAASGSRDKKYIYYSANTTGTQQIWRARPDGSGKEQLTFDQYHNAYPRISPDGKWMVFLSFFPDIEPDSHPKYRRVMLRIMPVQGGAPRVIAYLYGGAGTLSTDCWAADSRHITFVSNF